MYVLIIAIHAVFIFTTYLLGYRILEGIFLLLGLFFLFYFSPLFFLDEEKKEKGSALPFSFSGVLSQFSLSESIFLPISLLYIAIYGFIYSLFGSSYDILSLHVGIVVSIYAIFTTYALFFYWKHDVYFDLFRFHTLLTLVSTLLFCITSFFGKETLSLLHPILGIFGLSASVFLLSYTKKENALFLWSFLLSLFMTLICTILSITPSISPLSLLIIGVGVSLFLFEFSEKIPLFTPHTRFFQYFSLFALLLFLPILAYIAFQTVQAAALITLSIIAVFFISIHTRYMNYIAFLLSILDIFFIYSLLFSDLVIHPSLSSLFLFIFFLPILVIGTTYFWQEEHPYDFIILHYSSLAFSVIYSVYVVFFISWWWDILFVSSLCIFGTALLLFLSYFRFSLGKTS